MPWERQELQAQIQAQLRGLRRSVLLCLARDAKLRPTAERLLATWNHMFDVQTCAAAACFACMQVAGAFACQYSLRVHGGLKRASCIATAAHATRCDTME